MRALATKPGREGPDADRGAQRGPSARHAAADSLHASGEEPGLFVLALELAESGLRVQREKQQWIFIP